MGCSIPVRRPGIPRTAVMFRRRPAAVPWLALLIAAACLAAVLYLLLQDSGGGTPGKPEIPDSPAVERPLGAASLDSPPVGRTAAQAPDRLDVGTSPAASRAPSGPVAGKVTGAVESQAGARLPGSSVVLTERVPAALFFSEEAGPTRRFTSITDQDGRFLFQNLPSDTEFDMWVFHAEHTPAPGVPVIGLVGEDQDVGVVRLPDGGRVFGRVTDTGGNPLPAQVEVHMQPTGYRGGTPQEQLAEDRQVGRALAVDCDPDGRYEVLNLAEGVWTLTASYEGYASVQVHPVVLMNNELQKEHNLELDTEFQIGGMVVDETRAPIPNAMINAARSRPRPPLNSETLSGPDGRFVLRGLPDGMYGLFVTAEGYTAARQIQAPAGKMDVEIVLTKKGGVAGRIVDASGAPVTRAEIAVHRLAKGTTSYGPPALRRQVGDPAGNYLIEGLDPGPYILLVVADGHAPTYSPGFHVEREVVRGVDVQLQLGASLSGLVVTTGGVPLPGAMVTLHGRDYSEESQMGLFGPALGDPNNVPAQTARTDAQGRFELRNAFPGDLKVEIKHPTHIVELVPVTLNSGGNADLGTVQLRPGAGATGIVRRRDGSAVAGATVYLTRPPVGNESYFSQTITTDARGRFRFQGLRAGTYELNATPPELANTLWLGVEEGANSVYLEEGRETEVNLDVVEE